MWQALMGNLLVVALVFATWAHIQRAIENRPRLTRLAVLGITMGCGAAISILFGISTPSGIIVDLRTPLLAIASYFGGPVGALTSLAIAGSFRLAMGGVGTGGGLIGMCITSSLGLGAYYLCHRGRPNWWRALIFSAIVAPTPILILMFAPKATASLLQFGVPLWLLNVAVTFGASCLNLIEMRQGHERRLLRAALQQAPDFLYVKNTRHQFVAVNEAVACFNGFREGAEMLGKSDLDLTTPERAATLMDLEQKVMRSGLEMRNLEENLVDASGDQHWFSTSKTPIRDADGEVIGITGVTKDISEFKRLETELIASRNQLSYVLTEMSDGLALFDQNGVLVFHNQRYHEAFPLTAHVRVPGTHIRDILRAVVETGEQRDIPFGGEDAWIDRTAATLTVAGDQEVNLSDGRWMQIRSRPTSDGWVVVVISDVTTIKQAEVSLLGLTDELKLLATTDSLTGLLNRRGFDEALDVELARSARDHTPISLLLVDVDRFKAYNDLYGHPAGDECLRRLSACIRAVVRRPGDDIARYGGEEFVIILPNTGEDGAFTVAEQLRTSLRDLAIPHGASEKQVVTVSIGLASYTGHETRRRSSELIVRADEALYTAKEAGRDRATGWRAKHPINERLAAIR
ncbi:diguanylate cyclase [Devosia sp.]|uniref:diguanylate cyclase n=1 Tax=Devosia sp. TaxID=1871048 RepID=UPI003BAC3A1E